jgi:hypothetical protein
MRLQFDVLNQQLPQGTYDLASTHSGGGTGGCQAAIIVGSCVGLRRKLASAPMSGSAYPEALPGRQRVQQRG